MDFQGSEVYFNEEKALIGKTYGEAIAAYEDSSVIGLQFADGRVKVNPPMHYEIKAGDKIIAIIEDDDTLVLKTDKVTAPSENAIVNQNSGEIVAERILLLGWKAARSILNPFLIILNRAKV